MSLLEHLSLLEKLETITNIAFSNKIIFALESEIKSLADGQPKITEQNLQLLKSLDENLFSTFELEQHKIKSFKNENLGFSEGITDVDLATFIASEDQNGLALLELPIRSFKNNEEINIKSKFPQAKN